jgi:hypothetical protein
VQIKTPQGMKEEINIGTGAESSPILIDLQRLLETRALVQAGSGGGKSWLLRRLVEQCWGHVHIIIIDPEGEFVTLAEKFDVVIAGQDGDVPLSVESAAKLAQVVMKNSANIVCDIYDLPPDQRHQWVRNFVNGLVNTPKEHWHKVIVVMDEAHMFAPEKGQGESPALGAISDLVSRGRKRGMCPILATQRLGKLNKNVAAELQNVVIGLTTIDIDRERAAQAMGISRTHKAGFFVKIRQFDPGEFFVSGPAFGRGEASVFKSGPVTTTHARDTTRQCTPTQRVMKGAFAEIVAEVSAAALAEDVEVPGLLTDFHESVAVANQTISNLREEVGSLQGELATARLREGVENRDRLEIRKRLEETLSWIGRESVLDIPVVVSAPATLWGPPVEVPVAAPTRAVRSVSTGGLGRCERTILTVLSRYGERGCTYLQLTLLSGYGWNGSFRNCLGELRSQGFVRGANMDTMTLTPDGKRKVSSGEGAIEVPNTGTDVWNLWMGKLDKCGVAIMNVVRDKDGLNGPTIAEIADYGWNGSFRNILGSLRTANLVVGKNMTGISLAPALRSAVG